MQTYLIVSAFRQRRNKKGQLFGWHLSIYETPETKWGHDYVTGAYQEDPAESWKKIVSRMKSHFPAAEDEQVWKLLGMKYPGEDNRPEKKKKAVNRKLPRAQELPWPENLMREIGLELVFPDTGVYRELSDDQMVGLLYVTGMLKEKEQTVIRLRYEDHRSLQETADSLSLSRERIRQIKRVRSAALASKRKKISLSSACR